MSTNTSLLAGKTLPFIRVADGVYQSKAYWGAGKVPHRYVIKKFHKIWTLQIDDGDEQPFDTKKAAVLAATEDALK